MGKPEKDLPIQEVCARIILSPEIVNKCIKLYRDGHNAPAVETAYKLINKRVKIKSGLTSLDGMALMQAAFSLNNPKIKLNKLETNSERDEQLGYMSIFGGCMTGIRNPRAHEPSYEDSERTAFALLLLADHLMQKLDSA